MRWIPLLCLAVLMAGCGIHAHAVSLRQETGQLSASQAEVGPADSTNSMSATGSRVIFFEYVIEAGTATIEIQQQLTGGTNADNTVANTSLSASGVVFVKDPGGTYKARFTACTACTVTINYMVVYSR